MGRIVLNRRAAITAENAEKRLTLCNQLPQKRHLSFASEQKIYNKSSFISLSC